MDFCVCRSDRRSHSSQVIQLCLYVIHIDLFECHARRYSCMTLIYVYSLLVENLAFSWHTSFIKIFVNVGKVAMTYVRDYVLQKRLFSAKEIMFCKRDYVLQKRHIFLISLPIVTYVIHKNLCACHSNTSFCMSLIYIFIHIYICMCTSKHSRSFCMSLTHVYSVVTGNPVV